MHVELVGVGFLPVEAKALEEEEDVGEECGLEVLGVGREGRGEVGRRLERFDPQPLLSVHIEGVTITYNIP